MLLSKKEINKLNCVFDSEEEMCNSSADTISQGILLQNCIFELHSNKNKIQKQKKFGTRFENKVFQCQAKHKNNL
jgi:hypothetical protein